MQNPNRFLEELFRRAVERAHPLNSMVDQLPMPPKGRTVVVGAGKAAGAMAQAMEGFWPKEAPLSGAVVTPYGHKPPGSVGQAGRIAIYESAHPIPDDASVFAARTMLDLVKHLSADDLVICLLSGGASALLALPIEGVSLSEKQAITRQLLICGAPIDEMNVVRQCLSQIKGGQLAHACGEAKVLTLAISDVPGDRPEVIGSGPTIQTAVSLDLALEILDRYHIEISHSVRQAMVEHSHLRRLHKPRNPTKDKIQLIATPAQSLMAAAERANALGIRAYVLSDSIEGESKEVARFHADIARAVRGGKSSMQAPCVILSGGETTVRVSDARSGVGRGGRAGEFCLALSKALGGTSGIWALAADTDGIDGCETNAGAFVSPETLGRAQALGMSIDDFLMRHDSYRFFEALGDLFITGPTQTNVNDFRAILIT